MSRAGGPCRPLCATPTDSGATVPEEPLLPIRFAAELRAGAQLARGDRVVLGLSGGLDSVVLLHLLRFTGAAPGIELYAAHYDHALRPDSQRDADWVQGLCRAWHVPLRRARASAPARGEAAARAQRHAFLQHAADEVGAAWILTAHQADDQLETLLFRLARGTGLRGLRGIPERRGQLLRPLLRFRREELLDYALRVGLRWREDPSNRSLAFSRNRIRHAVLPALEARWPDAARRLLQLAATAAGLERLWQCLLPDLLSAVVEQRAGTRITLARGVLREYHPHSRARVLRELAHQLGAPLDRAATAAALRFVAAGASGGRVPLGAGLELRREFEGLVLERPGGAEPQRDLPLPVPAAAAGSGRACIGGEWFDVSWGPLPPAAAGGDCAIFDPSTLRFPLLLRGWRPGDRIRLGYGTKKLKKLFAERRVARSRRHTVPVLAEQAGSPGVLWVPGVAQAAPAGAGRERWHIRVSHGESG